MLIMTLRKKYYFSHKIEKGPSKIHGKGQHAVQPIVKGELVLEAGGTIFSPSQFSEIESSCCSFLVTPSNNFLVSEASEKMNVSYLNHSCDPNLFFEFPRWYALRDIAVGEELTTDYSLLGYPKRETPLLSDCQCGVVTCRKIVEI